MVRFARTKRACSASTRCSGESVSAGTRAFAGSSVVRHFNPDCFAAGAGEVRAPGEVHDVCPRRRFPPCGKDIGRDGPRPASAIPVSLRTTRLPRSCLGRPSPSSLRWRNATGRRALPARRHPVRNPTPGPCAPSHRTASAPGLSARRPRCPRVPVAAPGARAWSAAANSAGHRIGRRHRRSARGCHARPWLKEGLVLTCP